MFEFTLDFIFDLFGNYLSLALGVLLLSSVVFYLLLKIVNRKRSAGAMESEMAVFLRAVHTNLLSGTSFRQAFSNAIPTSGPLAVELRKVTNSVANGLSFQQAVHNLASSVNSLHFRRACASLSIAFETSSSLGLVNSAEQLEALQRVKIKQFSATSATTGMIFTIATAVLPALTAAFALLSGSLSTPMDLHLVNFAFLIAFPLIQAGILLLIYSTSPVEFVT